MPNSENLVKSARMAEQRNQYVSYIFQVFSDSIKDLTYNDVTKKVNKSKFVQFVKHFIKNRSETQITDMFMHIGETQRTPHLAFMMKRLGNTQGGMDDTLASNDNSDLRNLNFDETINYESVNFKVATYGMSPSAMANMLLELKTLDAKYS